MKLHRNTVDAILNSLHEIFSENKYADKVIERILKTNPKWGSRDRKFIAETIYDIVRWYRLLVYSLPYKEVDYEKIFSAYCALKGIKEDKIISEKLEGAKSIRKIRESIPDWMDELGVKELGEEKWEKEIHALNEEAKVVLRANTLKTSREELQKILLAENIDTEVSENYPSALILKKRQNIFSLQSFRDGLFEVQDAASQMVAPFLDSKEGMRVIDACAGAGGKTLHLAALMNNKGKIIALDTEQWKLDELKKRARRAGANNIEPRLIDSSKTIKRMENSADRLLLDVPCSGLGVLKRNPDAKWKLTMEFIEKIKLIQQKILNDYSIMLKEKGILVYSTCSILSSENEKQIEKFLMERKNEFCLMEQKTIYPSEGFDGFFMAKIQRTGSNNYFGF
ncbi:MAG: methyltransferase domain-containing protein [Bacteroidetes bacterium]|nr:methyltransferase domain-containing protein [Bacteroidota bacterium]